MADHSVGKQFKKSTTTTFTTTKIPEEDEFDEK